MLHGGPGAGMSRLADETAVSWRLASRRRTAGLRLTLTGFLSEPGARLRRELIRFLNVADKEGALLRQLERVNPSCFTAGLRRRVFAHLLVSRCAAERRSRHETRARVPWISLRRIQLDVKRMGQLSFFQGAKTVVWRVCFFSR